MILGTESAVGGWWVGSRLRRRQLLLPASIVAGFYRRHHPARHHLILLLLHLQSAQQHFLLVRQTAACKFFLLLYAISVFRLFAFFSGFFFFCIFSLCSRLNGFAVFTFDIFGVASVGACCMRLRCVLYVAAGASIATSICPRWYRRIGASIRDLQTYYLFYVRMSNGSSCSIQLNWLLLELFCWRKSFCSLTFKC